MFRAVLQKNNVVLRGLIGSLLRLKDEEMISVEITNPIIIGEAVEDKEYRLDINVLLNNCSHINLEMQVANRYNWENRSLSYLCRTFDQLSKGSDYEEIQPAIQISILDYTLFPDSPEFYSSYKMLNIKNHHVYSDNFILNVLDLTKISLASDEDKLYQIDHWARLFKATTWEGLRIMASENNAMQEACNTMFQLSEDELVRKRCRDREDYYADLRGMHKKMAEKDRAIVEKNNALAEKDNVIAEKDNALAEKDNVIAEKDNVLAEKDNALAEAQAEIERLKAQLQKKREYESFSVN